MIEMQDLRTADWWFEKHGTYFEQVLAQMSALPLADNSFDWVFCCEVLHHSDRRGMARVLKEIHRVLRPGGSLLIINEPLRWAHQPQARPQQRGCAVCRQRARVLLCRVPMDGEAGRLSAYPYNRARVRRLLLARPHPPHARGQHARLFQARSNQRCSPASVRATSAHVGAPPHGTTVSLRLICTKNTQAVPRCHDPGCKRSVQAARTSAGTERAARNATSRHRHEQRSSLGDFRGYHFLRFGRVIWYLFQRYPGSAGRSNPDCCEHRACCVGELSACGWSRCRAAERVRFRRGSGPC